MINALPLLFTSNTTFYLKVPELGDKAIPMVAHRNQVDAAIATVYSLATVVYLYQYILFLTYISIR